MILFIIIIWHFVCCHFPFYFLWYFIILFIVVIFFILLICNFVYGGILQFNVLLFIDVIFK